jgi:high-affinity nickel-transport protein
MSDLPADWSALCALVFVLGLKHGLDADHLAAIDGMTRLNGTVHRRLANWCGALFSLGHGSVVIVIALAVAAARSHWQPPAWLDAAGAWISIAFLLVLGIANLRTVLAAAPGECVAMVGVRGRLLGRWAQARSAWAVTAVGALFALSFDTVSQAALFSVTAAQFGGIGHALLLGALFVIGMLVTDALNGWWIGRLIRRADALAARASQCMGCTVALISLGVAALGITRQVSTSVDNWAEDKALLFGTVTVAVVALSYGLTRLVGAIGAGAQSSEHADLQMRLALSPALQRPRQDRVPRSDG